MYRATLRALAVIGLIAAVPHAARAQDNDYPNRTTTIVVPFVPGGITDVLARIIAQKLTERLGRPFVVENKGGAGTVLGAVSVMKAPPDGYTLLLGTNGTFAINQTLYKTLPYDAATDFAPVALIGSVPFVLVSNPDLPIRNLSDMLALARSKPGTFNFSSGGAGSSGAMFFELLLSMTQTKMTHVAYRGNVPAMTDVMAGAVQFMFTDLGSAEPLVAAGKLRALAVSTADRVASSPNIPTAAEAGVPGYSAESWQMLSAPAQTPKAIVSKLNAEINAIIALPDVREQMTRARTVPIGKGEPAALQDFTVAEIKRWGDVVRGAGLAGTQ